MQYVITCEDMVHRYDSYLKRFGKALRNDSKDWIRPVKNEQHDNLHIAWWLTDSPLEAIQKRISASLVAYKIKERIQTDIASR